MTAVTPRAVLQIGSPKSKLCIWVPGLMRVTLMSWNYSNLLSQDELMSDEAPQQNPATVSTSTEPFKGGSLRLKVSEKGAVSVYGLGRFPVTLYKEQWKRLLAISDQISAFIRDNDDKLKAKTKEE